MPGYHTFEWYIENDDLEAIGEADIDKETLNLAAKLMMQWYYEQDYDDQLAQAVATAKQRLADK